jgi:hypothetical protein
VSARPPFISHLAFTFLQVFFGFLWEGHSQAVSWTTGHPLFFSLFF